MILNARGLTRLITSSGFAVRHIFRPTIAYAGWIIELFKPSLSVKENIFSVKKQMLKLIGDINEKNREAIAKSELYDMLLTDVPYFYYRTLDNAVCHLKGVIIRNFYQTSFYDFICKWFSELKTAQNLDKRLENLILKRSEI